MLSMALMWDSINEADRREVASASEKIIKNSSLAEESKKESLGYLQGLFPDSKSTWSNPSPKDNSKFAGWLAGQVDHTLLKPEATRPEFEKLCSEAREFEFKTVCVPANRVQLCRELLEGSGVLTITVIGFPLGYTLPEAMAAETAAAIEAGAAEVDMVIPYGALRDGDIEAVWTSVGAVVLQASQKDVPVKAILESAALTDIELACASAVALAAGADFIKTSTGFSSSGGASTRALNIMRLIAGSAKGVKASGGIRDQETTLRMIQAGASRIGASASVAIVRGNSESGGGY